MEGLGPYVRARVSGGADLGHGRPRSLLECNSQRKSRYPRQILPYRAAKGLGNRMWDQGLVLTLDLVTVCSRAVEGGDRRRSRRRRTRAIRQSAPRNPAFAFAPDMPSIIQESSSQPDLASSTPHYLLPFLQSQPQNTLARLYQRPSSCLSIFRSKTPF